MPVDGILVCVHIAGRVEWFRSPAELWVLDRRAWFASFREAGVAVREDHSERFGIAVVDSENAPSFLSLMEGYRVNLWDLRRAFERAADSAADWFDVAEHLPSVFIDFDKKQLWCTDVESPALHLYAPQRWVTKVAPFFDQLPAREQYWNADGDRLAPFLRPPGKSN